MNQERTLGKLMIIAAWILLLALLTSFFNQVMQYKHNPNGMVQGVITAAGEREVKLKRNAQGHYVAEGRINGKAVLFLVDTGATQIALSEDLAQRLGLKKYGGTISQTANGAVTAWQTILDEVQLGTIVLSDVQAVIMPNLQPENQVLLGMSFLNKLELIQKQGQLTLRLPSP